MHSIRQIVALAGLTAAVACQPADPEVVDPDTETAGFVANCLAGSRFDVQTWGAFETTINWVAADMECSGMRRPDDEGARLRFAGKLADSERQIALILSIPDLVEGELADELPTRVTVIEEDEGRFFSTQEADICWTNITAQDALAEQESSYRIGGLLYCVSPIAELNGTASVTLSDATFTGQLSWTTEP